MERLLVGGRAGDWSPDNFRAEPRLQLGRGALGDHPAVVDDRDRVGEPVGLVQVLGGQQHGRPGRGERAHGSQVTMRLRGSRPVVGSSRNRTLGRATRLAARSRRRRMPPE